MKYNILTQIIKVWLANLGHFDGPRRYCHHLSWIGSDDVLCTKKNSLAYYSI